MDLNKELQQELQEEYEITQRFFDLIPDDKLNYKPHEKSMAMFPLSIHIAEIFAWPKAILDTPYWDFAVPFERPNIANLNELKDKLNHDFERGFEALNHFTEKDFDDSWDIRQGDQIFMQWNKYGAVRHALNQITHHRSQLGVYFRLNDIFVPSSYGPSADDADFA